jgi:hypothetical protein
MSLMARLERITVNPGVCLGQPTIRGMRITVRVILKMLASSISSLTTETGFFPQNPVSSACPTLKKRGSFGKNPVSSERKTAAEASRSLLQQPCREVGTQAAHALEADPPEATRSGVLRKAIRPATKWKPLQGWEAGPRSLACCNA